MRCLPNAESAAKNSGTAMVLLIPMIMVLPLSGTFNRLTRFLEHDYKKYGNEGTHKSFATIRK